MVAVNPDSLKFNSALENMPYQASDPEGSNDTATKWLEDLCTCPDNCIIHGRKWRLVWGRNQSSGKSEWWNTAENETKASEVTQVVSLKKPKVPVIEALKPVSIPESFDPDMPWTIKVAPGAVTEHSIDSNATGVVTPAKQ